MPPTKNFSEWALQWTCEKTGVSKSRLEVIAEGYLNPVRKLDSMALNGTGMVRIGRVAETYCGVDLQQASNKQAVADCLKLLRTKFPEIGLNEIDEAFSMAAAQLIDVSLTAFGGRFTVAMFGAVLSAYRAFRNNVLVQMSKGADMESEEKEALENEKRNAEYRAHVVSEFNRLKVENRQIESADKVPAVWAKILNEHDLLNSNTALWLHAKQQVCADFLRDVANNEFSILIGNGVSCRKLADKIKTDPEYFPIELKPAAEILYGRWIVFSNLAPFEGDK